MTGSVSGYVCGIADDSAHRQSLITTTISLRSSYWEHGGHTPHLIPGSPLVGRPNSHHRSVYGFYINILPSGEILLRELKRCKLADPTLGAIIQASTPPSHTPYSPLRPCSIPRTSPTSVA